MKASDIVQLKRDLTTAIDAAGRGEQRWYVLIEKLDELGYDIVQRPPTSTYTMVRAVDWAAQAVPEATLLDWGNLGA
jgi:hypothetical protein